MLALMLMAGCPDQPAAGSGPVPASVNPDWGLEASAVPVVISGEGLVASVTTDFGQSGESVLDSGFTVRLGTFVLQDVTLRSDGTLTATVPPQLPLGWYDLTVVDPLGREGKLAHAFRVIAATDVASLVKGFRFEPIGDQQAYSPFPVTITAVDDKGRKVSTFSGSVGLTDRTGTVVPGTAGLFRSGVWTGQVEVRQPMSAEALVARDALGNTGTSNDFTVAGRAPVALRFSTPPRTVGAGACSPAVTVEAVDDFGVATLASAARELVLASSQPAGFSIWADAACTVPATPSIPAGQSTATIYFEQTRAGTLSLTASSSGLVPGRQDQTVLPGPGARLVFTTAPLVMNVGLCSPALEVEVRDGFDNPAPVPADALVAVSASPSTGLTFFTAPGCAVEGTSVPIAAGTARAAFSFRGTAPLETTVTATLGTLTPATQAERLNPEGFPTQLAIVTPPQAVLAGSCSELLVIEARDSFGNPAAGPSDLPLTVSAFPAGMVFFSDATCTTVLSDLSIPAGQASTGLYFSSTQPGPVSVQAASTGLSPAAQDETIVAAPPSALLFTSPPLSLVAGACSAPVTVGLRDAWGNPSASLSDTGIALAAAPSAGFQFFSDPGCASPTTVVTAAAGTSSATFYFRAAQAGSFVVSASSAGLTSDEQTEVVAADIGVGLAITTPAQAVGAGQCSGAVTVELRDANGNPTNAPVDVALTLAGLPSAGFDTFSDAGCTTAATGLTLAAGTSSASFFFRGIKAGPVDLTAMEASLSAATQRETILPGQPDRLVFTSVPLTVTAGVCSSSSVTVQAQDVFQNPVPLAAPASVSLVAAPASGSQLFLDGGCGNATSAVTIAAGASSATFSFKGTARGNVLVTATAPGWLPATQTESVLAAAANHLAFTTAPRSISVGACSVVLTLESQDPYGNPSPIAAATPISLAGAPAAGFGFYSDPACGTSVAAVTLAAGASAADFYFRGTVPGPVGVSATAGGLAGASQTETVLPANTPTQLVFTSAAQRLAAGVCSQAAALETQDSFGNGLAVVADTPVTLEAAPGAGWTFYSDAGCTTPVTSITILAGTKAGSFFFRGTRVGNVQVSATAAGINSASQTERIDPAAAHWLAFTTAPQTVTAGACSGLATVQSLDPHGNPSPATAAATISLAAAPATGFLFYSDPACATPIVSVPLAVGAGSASFYFRGTAAGPVTITAGVTGWTAATQVESIQNGPPGRLAFLTPARTLTAGVCSAQALTVQARDGYNNPASVSAAMTVNLSAAPAAGFTFFTDAGCGTSTTTLTIAAGASSGNFWVRGTATGSVVVTAAAAGMTSATQTESVNAATPSVLAFTTAAQSRTAGSCSGIATVQSRDSSGNVSPATAAATIALSAAPATGFTFYSDAACGTAVTSVPLALGASTASFYFKGTAAAPVVQVTASITGWTAATQNEAITAGPATQLGFTTPARTLVAGACVAQTLTVEARDGYGNPCAVAGATTVNLSAAPGAGFTFYSSAGCALSTTTATIAAGTTTASFWAVGTVAGSVLVTASVTGWTSATQTETVTAAPPSALAFTTAAQSRTAGGCSGIATVQSRDGSGNVSAATAATTIALAAVPATGFTFYSDAACATAVASIPLALGASTASFYFKGTAAGTVQVTATRTGWTAATQNETITAAAPAQLAFITAERSVASGACSPVATVQSRDIYGNPSPAVAAQTVALAASPAAGFTLYSNAACTTVAGTVPLAAGASTASFYFRGTTTGRVQVTATVTGWTPATQNAWIAWFVSTSYRKQITIQSARVPAAQVDFPVLINLASDADLAARARPDGFDLAFTLNDGVTQLSHEIERYNSTTGALVAWVKVPNLSSTANTVLYLYFGNPASTDQQAATDVWDLHYRGVWHLAEDPSGTAPQMADSTANNRHGTSVGTMTASDQVAGRIGGGLDLDGANDAVRVTGLLGNPTSYTLSGWVNLRNASGSGSEVISLGDDIGMRVDSPAQGIAGFFYNGATWRDTYAVQNIAGGGWHLVSYTNDGPGRAQRIYLDGAQVATSTFNDAITWGLGANTLIGNHGNGKANFLFNGVLDEIRVSDTPRAGSWIQTEFNNQSSPATFYTVGTQQFSG
ncbi:MAG: DUF2341 domain-containing protein [Myxococcales bacterium]